MVFVDAFVCFDNVSLFSFMRQGVCITLAVLEQYVDQASSELTGIHLLFPSRVQRLKLCHHPACPALLLYT